MFQSNKSTARDVFTYILGIGMLYTAIFSFIGMLFEYVNKIFPDQLDSYVNYDGIRSSTAALIVVWPVYLLMSWLIAKGIQDEPEKREMRPRKWLIYLTLFIAAVTIVIDLSTIIYNFLGGELTVKFFTKTMIILLIAVAVFGYYLWEDRSSDTKSNLRKQLAWGVSALLLVTIVAGFFIIGSPFEQRLRRFDERRINDLSSIQYSIINYWQNKNKLPENLDALRDDVSGYNPPVDPETNAPYEYKVTDKLKLELCSTFGTSNKGGVNSGNPGMSYPPYPVYSTSAGNDNWVHDAGHICFSRTIDPQIYKPAPVPVK